MTIIKINRLCLQTLHVSCFSFKPGNFSRPPWIWLATKGCKNAPIGFAITVRPSASLAAARENSKTWADFHEIWHWGISLKLVHTFLLWLKSYKRHFTWGLTCVSVNGWQGGESPTSSVTTWGFLRDIVT